jgi:hypothetical protein
MFGLGMIVAPLAGYFHYHGVRYGLLMPLGRLDEARPALDRTVALAHTPVEAAHIRLTSTGSCARARPRRGGPLERVPIGWESRCSHHRHSRESAGLSGKVVGLWNRRKGLAFVVMAGCAPAIHALPHNEKRRGCAGRARA